MLAQNSQHPHDTHVQPTCDFYHHTKWSHKADVHQSTSVCCDDHVRFSKQRHLHGRRGDALQQQTTPSHPCTRAATANASTKTPTEHTPASYIPANTSRSGSFSALEVTTACLAATARERPTNVTHITPTLDKPTTHSQAQRHPPH